jgi:serine-type D-Ala-D-Ala carboxypeptidase (penicillin-binding protein 5/6)
MQTTVSTTLVAAAVSAAVLLPGAPAMAAPAPVKPLPRLSAASYLVADLESGEVLAARGMHDRHRPASTLKVLTALTVLPLLDPADTYTAVHDDAAVDGSKVGIVPDATYSVHNLFEGLFLMSGNDAANALANAAGGVPQTVAAMNATADALGAHDTTAVNPSGLDAPGQVTSAYDLALFARAALERPDFRTYVTTVKSSFPGKMPRRNKRRSSFEIYTTNKLLLNYDGAIGVKNGWTSKARGTYVGAATRGDRTLVAVVLRSKPPSWEESAKLLDWGFANADVVTPVGTLEQPADEAVAEPETTPAARPAAAGTTAAAAPTGTLAVPWYVWPALALAAALTAVRARSLVMRRRMRRSYPATVWRQQLR